MRTSIEIMTSVSDETYYSRFSSQFLGSLKTATENVPLCCDVDFILLIGVLKSGLTEEFKDKLEFQVDLYLKDRVKLHIVALDSIPGRNSLLYSNSIQASYYTFIDFDDEVHPHYFKNFLDAVKANKTWDYIIGHAVRKDGDDLIPKDYLKWRPTTSMSKFFLKYGAITRSFSDLNLCDIADGVTPICSAISLALNPRSKSMSMMRRS